MIVLRTNLVTLFLYLKLNKGKLFCQPILTLSTNVSHCSKQTSKAIVCPFLLFIFLIFFFMEDSTKKCRECKADIPFDAKVCQHCKAKQGNWFSRHKIMTGILIIFIIAIIGNANTSNVSTGGATTTTNETQITKEEVIKITAKELFSQYEANEIQADDKYKNKILEVS